MDFFGGFFGGANGGNRNPGFNPGNRRGPGPGNMGLREGQATYQNFIKAYPASFLGRDDLDRGNKVLLPQAALAELANGNMPHPLIFRINSMRTKKIVYCGVLEFVAPDDTIIIPNWIFMEMQLMEEELINVFLVPSIPTANFLKLRPHQTAFINLPDPKAFLEIKFRDFVCLTQGDTITVKTDLPQNPEFKFDIIELKPVSPYKTVSIINCDLNLDFEAPLDYEEPPLPSLQKKNSQVVLDKDDDQEKPFEAFTGKHARLDGKNLKEDMTKRKEEYDPRKHRLHNGIRKDLVTESFAGKGVRLK